jgi:hypothetical protein
MVALCPTCHAWVAKLALSEQYAIKKDPYNVRTGIAEGALKYSKDNLTFKVGGNMYRNCPIILKFNSRPIIGCRLINGQAQISLDLLDQECHPIFAVRDNNIRFQIDDFWDFEYKHNWIALRHGKRDVALRIDLRKDPATIRAKIWLGKTQAHLRPSATTISTNGATIKGVVFDRNIVGLHYCDPNAPIPIVPGASGIQVVEGTTND